MSPLSNENYPRGSHASRLERAPCYKASYADNDYGGESLGLWFWPRRTKVTSGVREVKDNDEQQKI